MLIEFLNAASTREMLDRFNVQTSGSDRVYNNKDEDYEEEEEDDEKGSEEENELVHISSLQRGRYISSALVELIGIYDIDIPYVRSDLTMLHDFIAKHLPDLDLPPDQLEVHLIKLRDICRNINPVISSQKGFLSLLTGLSKARWVPQGESAKKGEHVDVWRRVLRIDPVLSQVYINQRARIQKYHLRNPFVFELDHVTTTCRSLYVRGMTGTSSRDIYGLMIGLETAGAGRISTISDTSITFLTAKQYREEFPLATHGNRIGWWSQDEGPSDYFELTSDWDASLDSVVYQIGTLKDPAQCSNAYMPIDDPRRVKNRVLCKPLVRLTATELVAGVARVRAYFALDGSLTRRQLASKFPKAVFRSILTEHFPDQAKHSVACKLQFNTHVTRKLYAACSYKIYKDRIAMCTLLNSRIERSVYTAYVLAHGDRSSDATRAYMTVKVTRGCAKKTVEMVESEAIRSLRDENALLIRQLAEVRPQAKAKVRIWSCDENGCMAVAAFIQSLRAAEIKPTIANIKQRGGFGSRVVSYYFDQVKQGKNDSISGRIIKRQKTTDSQVVE